MHIEAHKEFPWFPGVPGLQSECTEAVGVGDVSTRSSQKWQEAGNIFGDYCGQGTPVDIYQVLVVKHLLSTLALLEEGPTSPQKLKPGYSGPRLLCSYLLAIGDTRGPVTRLPEMKTTQGEKFCSEPIFRAKTAEASAFS